MKHNRFTAILLLLVILVTAAGFLAGCTSAERQRALAGRTKCSVCGTPMKKILYGLPGPNMIDMVRDNPDCYVLGGCVISSDNHSYYCPGCDQGY